MAQAASKLDEFFDDTGPWTPQDGPQFDAVQAREITEMLYGGAAFGGKTDFLLGDFLQDVPVYQGAWRGILFRKTMGELDDIIRRSHEIYPQTGAFYNESKATWRWPNGAYLRLRYLEQDRHKYRYQGHAYTWIGWDELTHWATDSAYRYLRSRLRSAAQDIPVKRIRATANPGGPGHSWVKARFIARAPGGYVLLVDDETKTKLIFIPSRISDNKIGLRNDPGYPDRLKGMGSAALVRAMLEGDWDVIEGAFFDCWAHNKHVIRPFRIPPEWIRMRSADWGSYSPFCIGWYAIAQDDFKHPRQQGLIIPRGAMIKYREWYGTRDPAMPGLKGLKMSAEKVGQGITLLEDDDEKISLAKIDPSTFKADGGPSIAEGINKALFKKNRAAFAAADNTRVSTRDGNDRRGPMGGWDQMRARLIGTAGQDDFGVVDWSSGSPMLMFFNTCLASIRTIPTLQHDAVRPEDLDTHSEDHAADETRYACNARPFMAPAVEDEEKTDEYQAADEALHEGGYSGEDIKTI